VAGGGAAGLAVVAAAVGYGVGSGGRPATAPPGGLVRAASRSTRGCGGPCRVSRPRPGPGLATLRVSALYGPRFADPRLTVRAEQGARDLLQ